MLRNCVQAHDNNLQVLQHIILYLSTRQPQRTGHPGHAEAGFFEIPYFQEFCLSRPRFFPKNRPKIIQKKIRGAAPRTHSLRGYAPPTHWAKVGAKCLAAVVLARHDRVLSPDTCCLCKFMWEILFGGNHPRMEKLHSGCPRTGRLLIFSIVRWSF